MEINIKTNNEHEAALIMHELGHLFFGYTSDMPEDIEHMEETEKEANRLAATLPVLPSALF